MSTVKGTFNPYLSALQDQSYRRPDGKWAASVMDDGELRNVRRNLVTTYSWAIPTTKAIQTLVEHGPILEVGAGNGYWASLAEAAGADVLAIDKQPPSPEKCWTTVEARKHSAVQDHAERSLFLCWPTFGNVWSVEAVEQYDGDTVIYVGEGRGGCTGCDELHRTLNEEFGLATEILNIPNWHTKYDRLFVFER